MIPPKELAERLEDLHLHTARLDLRSFRQDDFETALAHELHPEIMRYVRDPLPRDQAIERVQGFFTPWRGEEGEWAGLAVTLRGDRAMIGVLAFRILSIANETVEIGFRIDPEHQRRGYMLEACRRLIGFLIEAAGVRKVTGCCVADNLPSASLMEKLGMQREGRLRQFSHIAGAWRDELVYGLLPAIDGWAGSAAGSHPADRREA